MSQPTPSLAGASTPQCGKWVVDRLLARGGTSVVYAAHGSCGPVALKVLQERFADNGDIVRRFEREAELTRSVQHPACVKILDEGVSDTGLPYFVMELLDGSPLDLIWRRHLGQLPVQHTLEIALEVLELLKLCHEQGIVHRDLKPSNIFITNTGKIKVLDFGIARKHEEGVDPTLVGTALGTPSYMAPEQALGVGDVDGRADIFSMGATLFALLSGKTIRDGCTSFQHALVQAVTNPAPSLRSGRPDILPVVCEVVDRALQHDSDLRFQSATEMRDAILTILPQLRRSTPSTITHVVRRTTSDHSVFAALEAVLTTSGEGLRPALDHWVDCIHMRAVALGTLTWEVHPESFRHRGAVLWAPEPPLHQVPARLRQQGVEELTIRPGVTAQEIDALHDLLTGRATSLLESGSSHIAISTVSSGVAPESSVDIPTSGVTLVADPSPFEQPLASGTLDQLTLARLLAYALDYALTGTLRLGAAAAPGHLLLIRDGVPERAWLAGGSVEPLERFTSSRHLFDRQLVTDAEVERQLLSSGAPKAALIKSRNAQLRAQIQKLAELPKSTPYTWISDLDVLPDVAGVIGATLPPLQALLVAARAEVALGRSMAVVRSLGVATLRMNSRADIRGFAFSPEEAEVLRALRLSEATVPKLCADPGLEPMAVEAVLYALALTRSFKTEARLEPLRNPVSSTRYAVGAR